MPLAPYAEPFFAPPTPRPVDGARVGVLLVHGFTGSPASVVPWGRELADRGYAVAVPRLPGHGTSWQEMNRCRWQDWYAEADRGLDKLRSDCDQVVVGGLSMGATIALLLAARRGRDVAGVVSVNVSIANADPLRFALPVLKRLRGSRPGIAGDINKPGQSEHGYDRLPLRAAAELLAMYPVVQRELPAVTQPVLVLRSAVDHVADPGSHQTLLRLVSSRDVTETVLANSYHVATLDFDAPVIVSESARFVDRVTAA